MCRASFCQLIRPSHVSALSRAPRPAFRCLLGLLRGIQGGIWDLFFAIIALPYAFLAISRFLRMYLTKHLLLTFSEAWMKSSGLVLHQVMLDSRRFCCNCVRRMQFCPFLGVSGHPFGLFWGAFESFQGDWNLVDRTFWGSWQVRG